MILIAQSIMTSLHMNNTMHYARWLQATRKGVSWQFLCVMPAEGVTSFAHHLCFLLFLLAREEAPFFSTVYHLSDMRV